MRKMINKILLLHPPRTLPSLDNIPCIQEPLGILSIAAYLRDNGYDVNVLDFRAFDRVTEAGDFRTYGADHKEMREHLKKYKPDLIGVSCLTIADEFDLFETCKIAKGIHPNTPVVVGGIHPTTFPERMLSKSYIDYVILGEGEYRLRYLIESLNREATTFPFDGVAYRKSEEIIVNKCTSVIEDLDSLPFPARDLVDMRLYSYINYAYINRKYYKVRKYDPSTPLVSQIEVTRGCFNRCTYCSVSVFEERRIRCRSIKNIIAEIKLLKKDFGITEVHFVQNNMAVNKKYMLELCGEIQKLKIHPTVVSGLWPNVLDREIIQAMARAGFKSIILALSSASKRVLKEIMHRPVNLDKIPGLVKECQKQGMQVSASFVLGMIGETKAELLESLNYPLKLGLDGAEFLVAFPLPGTEFYNHAKKKGYLPKDFDYRQTKFCQISVLEIPPDSPDFVLSPLKLRELIRQTQMDMKRQLRDKLLDQRILLAKGKNIMRRNEKING